MSLKIPCGGFKLDEKSFSLDKNDVLSIPKPLTYDYMPEGYPSKGIEYVTLMEEQEVSFTEDGSLMGANSPVDLEIKLGDKLTVVWDGVSYDVVVKAPEMGGPSGVLAFGNLGLTDLGDTEDYPFAYIMFGSTAQWATSDTSPSHTIKVMRQQVTITPMSTDFIPKNFNVVFSASSGVTPTSCNVTYDELRGWIESGVPVFAIYKVKQDNGSVSAVGNIIAFRIDTDKLTFYYETGASMASFVYNSDGTFSKINP